MTLGENIWAHAIRQVEWHKLDEPTIIALGKIVIAAIDGCWEDLKRDHAAEIAALEDERCR